VPPVVSRHCAMPNGGRHTDLPQAMRVVLPDPSLCVSGVLSDDGTAGSNSAMVPEVADIESREISPAPKFGDIWCRSSSRGGLTTRRTDRRRTGARGGPGGSRTPSRNAAMCAEARPRKALAVAGPRTSTLPCTKPQPGRTGLQPTQTVPSRGHPL
jgi:hypothetical protein